MRKLTWLAVIAAGALCGAAHAVPSDEPTFSAGNLLRIVGPKPPASAGACRPTDPFLGGKPAFMLRELAGPSPSQKAIVAQLKRSGFESGYQKVWSCSEVGDAAVFVFLFRDGRGARAAVAPLRAIQPCGRKLAASGLGTPSWGCSLQQGSDRQALFGWRRGNLVIVAETLCEGCDGPVASVARAYAGALDARAGRQ